MLEIYAGGGNFSSLYDSTKYTIGEIGPGLQPCWGRGGKHLDSDQFYYGFDKFSDRGITPQNLNMRATPDYGVRPDQIVFVNGNAAYGGLSVPDQSLNELIIVNVFGDRETGPTEEERDAIMVEAARVIKPGMEGSVTVVETYTPQYSSKDRLAGDMNRHGLTQTNRGHEGDLNVLELFDSSRGGMRAGSYVGIFRRLLQSPARVGTKAT